VHGVEHHAPHAFQVAPGVQIAVGQLVLRADVLAAAALEDQIHLEFFPVPFLKVHGGKVNAGVVAAVLAGETVHSVRPQIAFLGGDGARLANLVGQLARGETQRVVNGEDGRAGVLADRRGLGAGHLNILQDRVQRAFCRRAWLFVLAGCAQRAFHVCGEKGRGTAD